MCKQMSCGLFKMLPTNYLFINHSYLIYIGLMSRLFTNGPVDRGSIPVRIIPKPQKWYLMPPCLTLSIIR